MQKSDYRSADCVVSGFRWQGKSVVGSLLLGLSMTACCIVGFTSTSRKRTNRSPPSSKGSSRLATGNAPGGPSRWSTTRSAQWRPLKPVLVAEVRYDHLTGNRFRHGTTFVRWRRDKSPRQCTMEQVKQKRASLGTLLK
jgi:ATP-dependent DNA ligase